MLYLRKTFSENAGFKTTMETTVKNSDVNSVAEVLRDMKIIQNITNELSYLLYYYCYVVTVLCRVYSSLRCTFQYSGSITWKQHDRSHVGTAAERASQRTSDWLYGKFSTDIFTNERSALGFQSLLMQKEWFFAVEYCRIFSENCSLLPCHKF